MKIVNIVMGVVHVLALICLWTTRTALAALLILPITVNVVGLLGGAVLGNVMLLLNAYFLWQNGQQYTPLLAATS